MTNYSNDDSHNDSHGSGSGFGGFGGLGGNRGGFGGGSRLRFGPGTIGPAIKWIIIFTAVVFFIQQLVPLTGTFGFTPGSYFSDDFPNGFYKPFTYMFLHGGLFHILFNMLILWMFGTEFETMWGSRRFLRFYLLSGLGGALFSLALDFNSYAAIIGASGAVFGVMAAYWRYFPERKLYLYFVIPVKIRWAIPAFLLVPIIWSFISPGDNVAHFAHLGGAVVGFFLCRRGNAVHSDGALKGWFKRRKNEKLTERFEANRRKAEDVMQRVDSILDKINAVGLENITDEERKFLEEASERLSEDKRPK
jgi:rhomboid family protein